MNRTSAIVLGPYGVVVVAIWICVGQMPFLNEVQGIFGKLTHRGDQSPENENCQTGCR